MDLGEVQLNIGCAGSADQPALLLIPGQSMSWWAYEAAMDRLAPHFQVFAVDLRGQGRSSRTPGRYMLDNMGNDLVRLIAFRIRRPVVVAGLSSGGLLAAWLSAYAPPGMLRGAYYEDPPLFASELSPECGPGMRQHVVSDTFALAATYLGDQWQVGDWEGYLARAATNPMLGPLLSRVGATPEEVPQTWKEYDAASGKLVGAMTDQQAARVQDLVRATGQLVEFHAFPQMPHNMHGTDPDRYAGLLLEWAARLPTEEETRKSGVFATSSALVG